jgi:hypothetical protein
MHVRLFFAMLDLIIHIYLLKVGRDTSSPSSTFWRTLITQRYVSGLTVGSNLTFPRPADSKSKLAHPFSPS